MWCFLQPWAEWDQNANKMIHFCAGIQLSRRVIISGKKIKVAGSVRMSYHSGHAKVFNIKMRLFFLEKVPFFLK